MICETNYDKKKGRFKTAVNIYGLDDLRRFINAIYKPTDEEIEHNGLTNEEIAGGIFGACLSFNQVMSWHRADWFIYLVFFASSI